MTSGEWEYPITSSYVKHWSDWEIIREFVQNILDTGAEWHIGREGPEVVIRDYGSGITPVHLLLGENDKPEDARGKYGEGLKLAIHLLLRRGITPIVKSRSLEYTGYIVNKEIVVPGENEGDPDTVVNREVFRIRWEEAPEFTQGTEVRFEGWEDTTYQERFIHLPHDPRIVAASQNGTHLLDEPNIFDKEIYVCPVEIYGSEGAFGYNLTNVKLNRDRDMIESWDLAIGMGIVWGDIADYNLWVDFFKAIKADKAEKWTRFGDGIKHPTVVTRAIESLWAPPVVVITNDNIAQEAQYLGASLIRLAEGLKNAILSAEILQTDCQFVETRKDTPRPIKKDTDLDPIQRKHLQKARMVIKRAGHHPLPKVVAALLNDGDCGIYEVEDKIIKLSVDILDDPDLVTEWTCHELAHHIYPNAQDGTAGMVQAVQATMSRIINSYFYRW